MRLERWDRGRNLRPTPDPYRGESVTEVQEPGPLRGRTLFVDRRDAGGNRLLVQHFVIFAHTDINMVKHDDNKSQAR